MQGRASEVIRGNTTKAMTDKVEDFCANLRALMDEDKQEMAANFDLSLRAARKLDRLTQRMKSRPILTRADEKA